jgi:hypothetical protein
MRSRIVQFIFFFSKRIRKSRKRLSRRREWRQQCEAAKEYEEFLKIPILENVTTTTNSTATAPSSPEKHVTPLRSVLRKSRSVAVMETLNEEASQQRQIEEDSSPKRRNSLSRLKNLQEAHVKHGMEEADYLAIEKDLGPSTADLLLSTTDRLKEERRNLLEGRDSGLEFLLSGVVKRNHLTLEDLLVSNYRAVSVSGQYELSPSTRKVIASYFDEVSNGIDALANDSTYMKAHTKANSNNNGSNNSAALLTELQGRIKLLRKMKQNMGRTALMLSGGGAQAMYHLGTIRALIQSKLYHDIKVISGTSGGSIAAACCAMFTPEEIFNDICVSNVSTDYLLNGEMKRRNIRWFPPVVSIYLTLNFSLVVKNFLKHLHSWIG